MNIWHRVRDTFIPHARNNYTPYALGRKSLSIYAAVMLLAKVATGFSVGAMPINQAQASDVTSANVLQLTNYSRSVFGVSALTMNAALERAAEAKAQDMMQNQYFSHNSPQGLTPWDFIKSAGYNYIIAGENLALNFSTSEGLENAWMNSPGHKANILNKDFQDVGIGIVSGVYKGQQTTMVVEEFGTSINQPFTPQLSYTTPAPLAAAKITTASQTLVPVPSKIGLVAPMLDNPKFSLTDQKAYTLSGYAPGADTVYILVNHQPQAKMEVIQGHFSGTINLTEGANTINAVSFDNAKTASEISNNVTIQLDTAAPIISDAQMQPAAIGSSASTTAASGTISGQTYYDISIQASSDAAKVIATIGTQSVMLQPSATPDVWVGKVAIDPVNGANGHVMVTAYDLAGNSHPTEVATLTPNLQDGFTTGESAAATAAALASHFNYEQFNIVYLYFGLFILAALGFAIGVKRNIQHLDLIAGSSAVAALAIMLWIT